MLKIESDGSDDNTGPEAPEASLSLLVLHFGAEAAAG
jgi:hypothetical protein